MASKLRRHWEEFVPLQQEIRLNQCVTACRLADVLPEKKEQMDFLDQTHQVLSVASWEAQLPGEPIPSDNLLILKN